MRMTRTWDTTMSMIPKGGDTIWGNLDWSPEDGYNCTLKKQRNNDNYTTGKNENGCLDLSGKGAHFGRIISFGKDVAESPSSTIDRMDFRVNLSTLIYSYILPHKKLTCLLLILVSKSRLG